MDKTTRIMVTTDVSLSFSRAESRLWLQRHSDATTEQIIGSPKMFAELAEAIRKPVVVGEVFRCGQGDFHEIAFGYECADTKTATVYQKHHVERADFFYLFGDDAANLARAIDLIAEVAKW